MFNNIFVPFCCFIIPYAPVFFANFVNAIPGYRDQCVKNQIFLEKGLRCEFFFISLHPEK